MFFKQTKKVNIALKEKGSTLIDMIMNEKSDFFLSELNTENKNDTSQKRKDVVFEKKSL